MASLSCEHLALDVCPTRTSHSSRRVVGHDIIWAGFPTWLRLPSPGNDNSKVGANNVIKSHLEAGGGGRENVLAVCDDLE